MPKRTRLDAGSRLLLDDFFEHDWKLTKKECQIFYKKTSLATLLSMAEAVRSNREKAGRTAMPRTLANINASVVADEQPSDAEDEEMDAAAAQATHRVKCPVCRVPINKKKVPVKRSFVSGGDVDTCSVCQQALQPNSDVCMLSCGSHYMHEACFDSMLKAAG